MNSRWNAPDLADRQSRRSEILSVRSTPKKDYKAELLQQLSLVGIQVEPEFQMLATRKYKADWRVTGTNVLIEFEGGLFAKSKQGHSSVTGILRDIEKYNLCAIAGWKVIRVTPKHVTSGEALQWIEGALNTSRVT